MGLCGAWSSEREATGTQPSREAVRAVQRGSLVQSGREPGGAGGSGAAAADRSHSLGKGLCWGTRGLGRGDGPAVEELPGWGLPRGAELILLGMAFGTVAPRPSSVGRKGGRLARVLGCRAQLSSGLAGWVPQVACTAARCWCGTRAVLRTRCSGVRACRTTRTRTLCTRSGQRVFGRAGEVPSPLL